MVKSNDKSAAQGIDHKRFINKDGYPKGGVEVKIPEGIPTTNKVNGQKRMLAEKRSTVKWY
jgi:hypothetical protein